MSNNSIETLNVYQLAVDLSNKIWHVVVQWNKLAQDTVGKQLIRSADSISANIAEGYGRFHYKENRNFCYYSRGSILETKDWLTKSKARKLINEEDYEILIVDLKTIHHKLNDYIKFIGKANKDIDLPPMTNELIPNA